MTSINIERKKLAKNQKLILKKRWNQYLTYFALLTLFLFWFSQLQVLFVSLIAIAAAIVIAFKEVIMCLTGGLVIRSAKSFVAGQRVEIDGVRGFVLKSGLLVTKVLEIGPEKNSQQTTGDIVTLPNSIMLSKSVKNESYFKDYCIKSYQFRIEDEKLVEKFEKELYDKALSFCSSSLEDAKKSISSFCEKEDIVIPSVSPRTKLILDQDSKNFLILVKVPIRNSLIADLEQELNRFYLNWKINMKKS